jgi:hypothetical protein
MGPRKSDGRTDASCSPRRPRLFGPHRAGDRLHRARLGLELLPTYSKAGPGRADAMTLEMREGVNRE